MDAMNNGAFADIRRRAAALVKKYRAACIVFLVGLALALLPVKKSDAAAVQPSARQTFDPESAQAQMEAILSQIDGAGRVRLLLTLRTGEQTVYQTDTRAVTNQNGTTQECETVFQQTGSAQKSPVVQRIVYPEYQGALVLCEGADRAGVRLAVIEAVSSLTGLGSNKIAVVKLKGQ